MSADFQIPPGIGRDELDSALELRRPYRTWSSALKRAFRAEGQTAWIHDIRIQMRVSLFIIFSSLAVDFIALPHMFTESVALRLGLVAPFHLAGLFLVRDDNLEWMKRLVCSGMIAFAAMVMHLASHGSPEVAVRYSMATIVLLAASAFTLPLSRREFRVYLLSFCFVTVCFGMFPRPALPPIDMLQHLMLLAISGTASFVLAGRYWELNARNYLLDLRDRLTREELELHNERLRELSEQDPLTGVPNRRHFEQVFERDFVGTADAGDGAVALMMIDLDHFKQFNDRHGHQAGDQCLRLAGVAIEASLQGTDSSFARYGGEEFIAVLREREEGDARRIAQRIRLAISGLPGSTSSEPLVTTSIGVAIVPPASDLDREDLIEMADTALYAAKRAGRNRVEIVLAGEETEERLIA